MNRFIAIVLLAVAAFLPTVTVAQDAGSSVMVQDNQFTPSTLQVSAGTTVTWTYTGDSQHTITADDGSFDSGPINGGDTFMWSFSAPGTYAYYCQFHGGPGGEGMSGTIVVT
jgi:plastocyanin